MRHLFAIAPCSLAMLVTGCAVGAPPGFSRGNTWSVPLIDPLAGDRLFVPVMLDGKGPYVFAVDPDSPITVVDDEVLTAVSAPPMVGPRRDDWNDFTHPTFYSEIPNVRIGDLTVSLLPVAGSQNGVFDSAGRRVYGIIGRDVIADSLVFGFDRERGIAWLSTEKAFVPPAGAAIVPYAKGSTKHTPGQVVHKLVNARVDGVAYDLHVDLGHVSSQLRDDHWREAHLVATSQPAVLVDDTGTPHSVTTTGIAAHVTTAGLTRDGIGFVPFLDKRWWENDHELDGTLALDFLRPYSVAADWNDDRFYLSARAPATLATRLARWRTMLPSCAHAGCIQFSVDGSPPTADSPGSWTSDATAAIIRDPESSSTALEVVLAATSPAGRPLPRICVNLPAGVRSFGAAIPFPYVGARFNVIDVSPFPRVCAERSPCLQLEPEPAP